MKMDWKSCHPMFQFRQVCLEARLHSRDMCHVPWDLVCDQGVETRIRAKSPFGEPAGTVTVTVSVVP